MGRLSGIDSGLPVSPDHEVDLPPVRQVCVFDRSLLESRLDVRCRVRLVSSVIPWHRTDRERVHYDAASALIKSIRGSDPDAGLYWLARMLEAGEDVRFLTRRLVILASEDIGNADPQALPLAVAGMQACEFVGLPECRLTLSQMVTYLACAPKSNAATVAIAEATRDVREGRLLPVPVHLRDAHYSGAATLARHGISVCA